MAQEKPWDLKPKSKAFVGKIVMSHLQDLKSGVLSIDQAFELIMRVTGQKDDNKKEN